MTQPENTAVIAPQWVIEPAAAPVPVVACLPHGGRDFPAELAGDLVVRPDALWADWLTRELYAFLPELGITTVTGTPSNFPARASACVGPICCKLRSREISWATASRAGTASTAKARRRYQRSLSKQRMKLSRYRLSGRTHRKGIAATFWLR